MEISESKKSINSHLLEYVCSFLRDKNLYPIFCAIYGSHMYGTANENSDYDLYVIVESDLDTYGSEYADICIDHHNVSDEKSLHKLPIDLTVRSFSKFEESVKSGDPQAIELILSPAEFILVNSS